MEGIKYFETNDTKALMLLLQKHATTLFHPKQPEPIAHALQCANSSNFTTYLHMSGNEITSAISMGTFVAGKNNSYGVINFLIYENEKIGRLLLNRTIRMAQLYNLKSLTVFNLRTNAKLREFYIQQGAKESIYLSPIQEVFEFTL